MEGKAAESSKNVEVPEDLKRPTIRLIGTDGNAFSIMGRVARALREAGNSPEVVESYMTQATSGDYDHLLLVTVHFVDEG